MICEICNQEFKSFGFPSHLKRTHKILPKDYYDTYIGKPNICICGKETPFINLAYGYRQYCCQNCSRRATLIKTREKYGVSNISQVAEVKAKMKKSIKENWDNLSEEEYQKRCQAISKGTTEAYYEKHPKKEVIKKEKVKVKRKSVHKSKESIEKAKQTCLEKYGCENPYQSEEIKAKIKQTKLDKYNDPNYNNREKYSKTCQKRYGKNSYVETNEFKDKVIENQKDLYEKTNTKSRIENNIIQTIKNLGVDIIPNKHLKNYYLDIYIPSLNTAIEYNGNWWHSIEHGKSKDYHLKKSLVCRENGIRLIHIYEFESLDQQLNLLINYIKGQDNYPKNDFNKNNFSEIPEPEIIFKNDRYTVYGAGPLIKETV